MSVNYVTKNLFEVIVAFIVAFLVYQGLAFAVGTSVPIVSVASESMLPTLHKGDLVFSVRPDNLGTDDIVIYHANCPQLPEEDVIHRVIEFPATGMIITKGDNNLYEDPCMVEFEQVKGKVVFAVPLLGWPRLILGLLGI